MKMKNQMKTDKSKPIVTGSDFLSLGLYAFAGLGMEGIYAYLLEPHIYGASMDSWSELQTIIHWILTCVTWGIFAIVLIRKAEGKYQFPILKKGSAMALWQWGLCGLFLVMSLFMNYIDWGGFKIYLEFVRKGPLLFTFQYIYYAFETMLFLLIIVFGQKACELWFRKQAIPYGGIVCGLTWGLAHIFTKDLGTGLQGLVLGLMMGSVYLLVNRDLKKAYGVLFFLFVL